MFAYMNFISKGFKADGSRKKLALTEGMQKALQREEDRDLDDEQDNSIFKTGDRTVRFTRACGSVYVYYTAGRKLFRIY